MLDFIPYIPFGTENIDETIWNTALLSWKKNLTHLFNMQEKEFSKEVSSNISLSDFVHQVWKDQLDNTSSTAVDTTLVQSIFLLYNRLSNTNGLDGVPLLTIEKLCNFVLVYGESNSEQVRRIMTSFINTSEVLEQNLLSTLGMLVESVQSLPNLFSDNSKNKPLSHEILFRVFVLVKVLDRLLSSVVQLNMVKESFGTLDDVLTSCYGSLVPILKSTVEKDSSTKVHAFAIKQTLVSCFNTFADIHLFTPLGYISSTTDHHTLIEINAESLPFADTIIDYMTEKILGYIEISGLESSKTAFIDGPLIMDWQAEYHITEKLDYINQHRFGGEEERIEFLKLSMEQVRDAIESIGNWGDGLEQQRKKKHTPTKQQPQQAKVFENVERISKISQVHDLFPDLGDGFIEACLEANKDDVELVIMQLLEESLPESVAKLDRSMERKLMTAQETFAQLSHLESEAAAQDARIQQSFEQEESILKTRRNIYDNDEFDIFAHRKVDTSKVYAGKKDKGNADKLLDDKSFIQAEKKNVLQRVVDMYDDDYDDTYDDINDAGTMPDRGEDGDTALDIVKKKQEAVDPGVQNESVLVHTYVEHPDLFTRNGTVRKSTKRAELRKKTGMTDEQLEGWAIMFNRNPRKTRIMDKYMLFDGNQAQVSVDVSQAQQDQKKKENKRPPISQEKQRVFKDKNQDRKRNRQRDKKQAKASPLPPS